MWPLVLLVLGAVWVPSWGYGDDDAQLVVPLASFPAKGGHAGRIWGQGSSIYRPQQNGSSFGSGSGSGYGVHHDLSTQDDREVGVCYIEVPTASLVRDRSHVPAGNGSRPDMSRIRSCCKGYERNIYNFHKCDPICTKECINALCVAPDTCSCYPDHVQNRAGICVATCPIGCQNGYCSGGECLCRDGYKLDIDGKFCVPHCQDNCGGVGNCTAPNVCACSKEGYQSTSEGSCRANCGRCENGDCVAPNQCRCRQGYEMDINGECKPLCIPGCGSGRCVSPNVCDNPTPVIGAPRYPGASNPNSRPAGHPAYPSEYVTQYPSHQPQYPASQHSQNQSNPQTPYSGQQYPSGSGHYVINTGDSQYPTDYRPSSYPQYNSSGNVQYPANSQYPYSQYNASGNVQYPTYLQQPSQSQYPSSGSLHSIQSSYQSTQNSSHQQNSSTDTSQSTINQQQSTYGQYYPSGSRYPISQQSPYGQYNPSGSQYPTNPQQPSQGQYNPSGSQYPTNLQPSSQGQYNPAGSQYPTNPQPSSHGQYNHSGSQYPTNSQQPSQGQYYPSGSQHSTNSQQSYNPQSNYPSDITQQSIDQQLQSAYTECLQPCINATCSEGRCVCNPGYVPDRSDPFESRCTPYCPGGCTNGVCVGPYSCACLEGYFMQSHGVKGGRPRCVKRERRSLLDNKEKSSKMSDLLVYMIPDYDN